MKPTVKKRSRNAPQGPQNGRRPDHTSGSRAKGRPEDGRTPRGGVKRENIGGPLICWGRNPVAEVVAQTPERVAKLLVARGLDEAYLERLTRDAAAGGLKPQFVPREHLDKLAEGGTHQGVAAYVTLPKKQELEDLTARHPKGPALVVALDHLQDPRNLGAITRTAEAVGAVAVAVQENRSATLTGTVVKTSAGAALRLPVVTVVNLRRTLEKLKKENFWIVGLSGDAEVNLFDEPLPDRCVLVAGGEGEGLSDLTRKTCDMLVKLPMCKPVESLNASVAAALAMYHWANGHRFGAPLIDGEISDDASAPELAYRAPEIDFQIPEEGDWDDGDDETPR